MQLWKPVCVACKTLRMMLLCELNSKSNLLDTKMICNVHSVVTDICLNLTVIIVSTTSISFDFAQGACLCMLAIISFFYVSRIIQD